MSNDLLQKVVDTTDLGAGGGGLLNAEQSNRFIDYMWDATVLGSQVRTVRMRADTVDIDFVNVGERLIRRAVEATDTGENAAAQFTKISLSTEKVRLDWELSTESLEDGLEGEALEDHIARLMATQAGNDLEDAAINGDYDGGVVGLDVFDGWSTRVTGSDAHEINAGATTIDRGTFNDALRAMPRKYMARRAGLKFFSGSNLIQDYLFSLQQTSGEFVDLADKAERGIERPVRTEGPAGFLTGNAFGLSVQEVPYLPDGTLWLTFPQNLLWGVKREIKVYRQFAQKKDSIEYTMYCRVGTQIENPDAFVVVSNIAEGTAPVVT